MTPTYSTGGRIYVLPGKGEFAAPLEGGGRKGKDTPTFASRPKYLTCVIVPENLPQKKRRKKMSASPLFVGNNEAFLLVLSKLQELPFCQRVHIVHGSCSAFHQAKRHL